MSLPPLRPEKTTAGIVVDPSTLERVVPQSKRRDGTVRKELKIRPGFTPQEDVGRFRSSRQAQGESPKVIPGSRNRTIPTSKPDNPFANQQPKTKTQLKNEKRREKKRVEEGNKAWDESSGGDSDGDMGAQFGEIDRKREIKESGMAPKGSEDDFPPLGGSGGAPAAPPPGSIKVKAQPTTKDNSQDTTAILDTVPAAAGTTETAAELSTAPSPPKIKSNPIVPAQSTSTKTGLELSATSESPAQGSSTSTENTPARSDGDWKKAQSETQKLERQHQQAQQRRQRNDSQKSNNSQPNNTRRTEKPKETRQAKPAAPPAPEPRVRKEVKIRQGGANDLSSLASRVKNLVLENQKGDRTGKKEGSPAPADGQAA